MNHRMHVLLTIVFVGGFSPLASAQTKPLPNIVILATGGTIAGAAATGTQAGYTSGAVTIDAMLAAVPGSRT
jgi:L-asparaginase